MSNAAQTIRNDLKAAGYAAKKISVRSSAGGVRVEIKDASIPKSAVNKIAQRQSVVRRCEASGEILGGGNTFVSVSYARGVFAEAGAALTVRLRAGERRFAGIHVDTNGAAASHTWHVWENGNGGRHLEQISPFHGEAVAEILAERGELAAALAPAATPAAEPAAPAAEPAAPPAAPAAPLTERREVVAVALELLRRAVSELEQVATAETVDDSEAVMREAETLCTLALRELEC